MFLVPGVQKLFPWNWSYSRLSAAGCARKWILVLWKSSWYSELLKPSLQTLIFIYFFYWDIVSLCGSVEHTEIHRPPRSECWAKDVHHHPATSPGSYVYFHFMCIGVCLHICLHHSEFSSHWVVSVFSKDFLLLDPHLFWCQRDCLSGFANEVVRFPDSPLLLLSNSSSSSVGNGRGYPRQSAC